MKKAVIVFAIILVIGIVATVCGGVMLAGSGIANNFSFKYLPNQTVSVDSTRTLKLEKGDQIKLTDCGCEINITTAPTDKIQVKLNGTFVGSDATKPEIKLDKKDGIVTISLDTRKNSLENGFMSFINIPADNLELHMNITVPENYNGNFDMTNIAGELSCNLEKADITALDLINCAGELDIDLSKRGKAALKSQNCAGEIDIEGGFSSVICNNMAGEMDIEVANSDISSAEFTNTAGDVTITVPKRTGGVINVKNCMGEFKTDFTVEKIDPINFKGTLNEGGDFQFTAINTVGRIRLLMPK